MKIREYIIMLVYFIWVLILSAIVSYMLISIIGWNFNISLWGEIKLVLFRILGIILAFIFWINYLENEA